MRLGTKEKPDYTRLYDSRERNFWAQLHESQCFTPTLTTLPRLQRIVVKP